MRDWRRWGFHAWAEDSAQVRQVAAGTRFAVGRVMSRRLRVDRKGIGCPRGRRSRPRFLTLGALFALAQPIAAQSIPGVEIITTAAVTPPSVTVWEKHPTLYPGIGISPSHLLPSTTAQPVTVSGGRSSFRHYLCVHKTIDEIQPSSARECQLIADRTTPTAVVLTEAMIDHGGVAWHIAIGPRNSIRAQWLPIPATAAVAVSPVSDSAPTEYQGEIHPKANGLRIRALGNDTLVVSINGGSSATVHAGTTHTISALNSDTNTLTIEVRTSSTATIYTATLTRSLLPDKVLRAAVLRSLNKPPEAELAADELLSLRGLNLNNAGVRDLAGLEAAINLERLELAGNNLRNIADLAPLRSLSSLDLSNNALSNLAPLADLAALQTLFLQSNSVSDLAPLDALTELRSLALSDNAVSDLTPLAALTGLEELWLDGNAIRDVQPLGALPVLRYLDLGRNRIANLVPLGIATGLQRLWLHDNAIEDISHLWALRSLKWLDLERNAVRDVAALRDLPKLTRLRLRGNRIADVAPLLRSRNSPFGSGDAVGLRDNPLTEASLRDHVPALRRTGAAVLVGWPVPLFPAAADRATGAQGFVRVINRSDAAGEVLVEAVDDAGTRAAPVRLAIGPRQARHFNSRDLEAGNAAKGLSAGVGPPAASGWRLALSSTLDIEVLAYLRTPDGFLTSVHELLPRNGPAEELQAPIFNPARNRDQVSSLRLVNPNGVAESVHVWGVDDQGHGRPVTGLSVPPRGVLTVPATKLEAYRIGASGRGLGRGVGKWRLQVNARWPVEAVSLLRSPDGHVTNLSSGALHRDADGALRLPLFLSTRDPARQSFARVVNRSARDGVVWITAVDDAGERSSAVALTLPGRQTVHFHSGDLENGAPAKGLAEGVGSPTSGDWRLALSSELDIRAYSYIRTTDGFLASMHDTAPVVDGAARVVFFNPASNQRQRSLLRLVNNGAEAVAATITGIDDAGAAGGKVRATVPAEGALTLSAMDLEAGSTDLSGALDDGDGKWRLTVRSAAPLVVMSLLASASGHLTNLSTGARP